MRENSAALAVSLTTAALTVLVFQGGGAYIAPAPFFLALAVLAIAAWLPRFRSIAGGAGLFAFASILLHLGGAAVARGYAASWPTQLLGFDSIIWLPLALLSILLEGIVPSAIARTIHPSSAVSAAALMFVPTIGTDVIGTWHSQTPAQAAALVLVAAPFLHRRVRSSIILQRVVRIAAPCVVVLAGWTAAYVLGRGDVSPADLEWLLPLIAIPSVVGAILGVAKDHRVTQLATRNSPP